MSYRTAKKPILLKRGRNRKVRPKTFKTEASAKKWAEANKVKSYELVNLKNLDSKQNKIKVIVK
ncbi:hypothetical protein ACFL6I_22695 [candidate division KSB1 bacterium]